MELSPTRSTDAPKAMVSSAQPTHMSRAGAPAPTVPAIDWEGLLERTPETALRQIDQVVPKDDSEAQRLSVYEVRALAKLQRIGEAHAKAEAYFERWPSGPDVVLLQSLTGAHPKR